MKSSYQFDNWTIYQHGQDVWKHTKQLICSNFDGFTLPEWFKENHHFIINNLHDWKTISTYNQYHDCGKPFCLVIDSDGKKHFPNHAETSKKMFLDAGGDSLTAGLIGYDMMCHSGDIDMTLPIKTLLTLLITAFAEIHSNAKQFPGGTSSTSFKIKYKRLDKIGKKILDLIPKHEDSYAYAILRNDLPAPQKVVQAGHAVWEQSKGRQHPSIICLAVKNESKLKKTMAELIDNDIQFSVFREPLFDNTITAICTEPLTDNKREVLQRYQLLKDFTTAENVNGPSSSNTNSGLN